MDEIDEATYIGLCMGLQHELAIEPADEDTNETEQHLKNKDTN